MKTVNPTKYAMMVLFGFGLLFTGCSDNDSVSTEEQGQDYSEVVLSSEIDESEEAIDDIVIEIYEAQEENETSRLASPQTSLPDCITITVVMEQNYREVTVDFGSEGCFVNGHLLKGQIIMIYNRDPEAQEVSINYSFQDFYFDVKNILGSKSILRQASNDNGNPQFTKTVDFTIVWPNGMQASREGTKIREWIVGHGSGVWSDNVFEVDGDWTSTFVNGNSHSYEVLTPLRREVICYYFVSGNVDVQRTNFGGIMDYGEGSCDNQATFTFNNGEVIDITLN